MNCRSITIHNNQEELISMPKKNCLGTGSQKWSCLDSDHAALGLEIKTTH